MPILFIYLTILILPLYNFLLFLSILHGRIILRNLQIQYPINVVLNIFFFLPLHVYLAQREAYLALRWM